MVTDDQKQQIREYVADKPVELVYLFGSQATGNTSPMSDYDFAVLFNPELDKRQRFDLKLEILGFLNSLFHSDKVDVLDLNDAPFTFAQEVCVKGENIFAVSKKIQDWFEFKTFQKYNDNIYYLKRYTQYNLAYIAKYGP